MTHYVIISDSTKENDFRDIYRPHNVRGVGRTGGPVATQAEKIGNMVPEAMPSFTPAGQGRLIVGSWRMAPSDGSSLVVANSSWLTVVTSWPADWVYWPATEEWPYHGT
jgi:hypothetical protein